MEIIVVHYDLQKLWLSNVHMLEPTTSLITWMLQCLLNVSDELCGFQDSKALKPSLSVLVNFSSYGYMLNGRGRRYVRIWDFLSQFMGDSIFVLFGLWFIFHSYSWYKLWVGWLLSNWKTDMEIFYQLTRPRWLVSVERASSWLKFNSLD